MSSKILNREESKAEGPTQYMIPQAPGKIQSNRDLAKQVLERLIKEETRIVKGIFQCFETPGSTVKIIVDKYKGYRFEKTMTDGEMYDVPLFVARHLNGIDASAGAASDYKNPNIGTCSYPVHGFMMRGNSLNTSQEGFNGHHGGIPVPIVGISKRVKRYGFQSLEFAEAI